MRTDTKGTEIEVHQNRIRQSPQRRRQESVDGRILQIESTDIASGNPHRQRYKLNRKNKEAGQTTPGRLRVLSPKTKARELHQHGRTKQHPGRAFPGVDADHAGASPVASVLGIRSGATPRGRLNLTRHSLHQPSDLTFLLCREHDISTLP